jgi:endonuclease YncB( thermonuclease family)
MYDYYATIEYWHDGDTVILTADQGFGNSIGLHVRLYDCWCPELSTTKTPDPAGDAAAARVTELMPPGTKVWISTKKAPVDQEWKAVQTGQTFARWLGIVYFANTNNSIGDQLIAEGLGTRNRNS